jgi:hypothetical protein
MKQTVLELIAINTSPVSFSLISTPSPIKCEIVSVGEEEQYIKIPVDSIILGAEGNAVSIDIDTNTDLYIYPKDSSIDWLSVKYNVNTPSVVEFSATANTSLDREITIVFESVDKKLITERILFQSGLRQRYGNFKLKGGGSFNVLKSI